MKRTLNTTINRSKNEKNDEHYTQLSDIENEVRGAETNTVEYVWGKDLSGSFQGAGGVGGLLYEKRNGAIYIPYQDAFGNIMGYWDTNGVIVVEYTYDAFGKTIAQSGSMADVFRHRFSTKYYDSETGFYYYGYRYYFPELRRWLSRDPLEEEGGENLYAFCMNSPLSFFDNFGGKVSPFKFVGDPRNKFGDSGAYLGLWFPGLNNESLFYSIDLTSEWGQCDEDGKCPDKSTQESFSRKVSFWENDDSRRKDETGTVNAYLNLINTSYHNAMGFRGYLPNGEESRRGSPTSAGHLGTTWGNIEIKLTWRRMPGGGPIRTKSVSDNSPLWHEYLEKRAYAYEYSPNGLKQSDYGIQTISISWTCQGTHVKVSSVPTIENGPQRMNWRENVW